MIICLYLVNNPISSSLGMAMNNTKLTLGSHILQEQPNSIILPHSSPFLLHQNSCHNPIIPFSTIHHVSHDCRLSRPKTGIISRRLHIRPLINFPIIVQQCHPGRTPTIRSMTLIRRLQCRNQQPLPARIREPISQKSLVLIPYDQSIIMSLKNQRHVLM